MIVMKKNKLLLSLLIPFLFTINSDLKLNEEVNQEVLPLTMNLSNDNIMPLAIHSNGKYEVPLTLDLKMGADAFSKTAIVEKYNDNYYMTFTQVDSSNLANMTLLSEGKHGEIIKVNGNKISYTYTVSEEDLSKPFKFSVIVTVMNKLVDFEMKLNLNDALYKGESIDDLGERPALYIPKIEANVTDLEMEKGSAYILPDAKAKLNGKDIEVTKKVYLNDKEVEVKDNKLILSSLGEYNVIYSASSDKYKTSLGNNTKSTISFKIVSKIGASVLGKLEDINNILPLGSQLQINQITNGELFDKISNMLIKTSENYQIFDLDIYDMEGNVIVLDNNVNISLRIDDYFNRNDIILCHMDEDGNLNEINYENYGRYIKMNTNNTGVFIAYVPGVSFVMPMVRIVIITISSIIILIALISGIIIYRKKKIIKNN